MEPVTHFLTGACLGRAGFNRTTALATLTMTLAAEAPDIDILCYLRGSTFGFAHHRGFTHTFVGLPFICAAVLLLVWMIDRALQRFRGPARETRLQQRGLPIKVRWGLLYCLALLAGLSHILLDYTNNYGVRPFEPFSYRWYAWDIVFIYEPLLYVVLIGGLALPALFALVNEEVGARSRKPRGQIGAVVALIGVLALWGVRDFQHRRAISAMNERIYRGEDAIRVSAFPYPTNPFRWAGVVETANFYANMEVDSLRGEADPQDRAIIRYKPESTPVTRAAKQSDLGRVYMDWARFPFLETEERNDPAKNYLVRFMDLRFMYPGENRRVLRGSVLLDGNLNVIDEWWGEKRPD